MGQQNSAAATRQLFRPEGLASDPTVFRVFVKKRNKFIPGWLKINEDEIVFARTHQNYQCWPLAYLRRYGYTCSGVFFFESGRRCATGEGLHTFQSHQAERIFQLVQSRIKSEEFARGQQIPQQQQQQTQAPLGRASSVVSSISSLQRQVLPVQRFSSVGPMNGMPNNSSASAPGSTINTIYKAPGNLLAMSHHGAFGPPAGMVAESSQRQRLPSSSASVHSASAVGGAVNERFIADQSISSGRPRSVVSAVERSVYGIPHLTQNPHHHHGHHHYQAMPPQPPGGGVCCYLPGSASSSMIGSVHSAFQPLLPPTTGMANHVHHSHRQHPRSQLDVSGVYASNVPTLGMNHSFVGARSSATNTANVTASTTAASTPTPQLLPPLPPTARESPNGLWKAAGTVHPPLHQQHPQLTSQQYNYNLSAMSGRRFAPSRKQPLPLPAAPLPVLPTSMTQSAVSLGLHSGAPLPCHYQDHIYMNVDYVKGLHRTSRFTRPGGIFGGASLAGTGNRQKLEGLWCDNSSSGGGVVYEAPRSRIPLPSTSLATTAPLVSAATAFTPIINTTMAPTTTIPTTQPSVSYALLDLEKTANQSKLGAAPEAAKFEVKALANATPSKG